MKALILGLGVSGLPTANLLKKRGYEVYYYDKKVVTNEFKRIQISDLKSDEMFFDIVIKSPGIKNTSLVCDLAPLKTFDFTNDIEYAFRLMPKNITIIAITGTNGKTTLANYVYTILKECTPDCFLCGNIGISPINYIGKFKENSYVVMELSSFQIDLLKEFHPRVVVITNIYPNHLDMVSCSHYYLSKYRLVHLLKKDDFLFFNQELKNKINSNLPCKYNPYEDLFSIRDRSIFYKSQKIIDGPILNRFEMHHLLLALRIAYCFFPNIEWLKDGAKKIKTVQYRLESIPCNYPLIMINDAKSSNAQSLVHALKEYKDQKKIVIVGGINKSSGFEDIILNEDDIVFGFGRDGKNIISLLKRGEYFMTLKEIMYTIKNRKYKDRIVLFSPACSSFDQYDNYISRGKEFTFLVKEIFDEHE